MSRSELDLVRALSRRFDTAEARRAASIGIGDDAAVLRSRAGRLVWTVDSSVEGVHFDRRFLSLEDVGARAFHAAVSDVAAMGAVPVAALSALVLPRSLAAAGVDRLARGQAEAAGELRCPIIGGNLARGSELSITTTVLGVAKRPLTRSGARPGDELWLIGDVGLAAAGLRMLGEGRLRRGAASRKAIACVIAAWRRPRALVREGRALVGRARSAIDVSDGLAGDAAHVAESSRVRLVIEEPAMRRALRPELRVVADLLGVAPESLALSGGEDYALLATGPAARRPRGARRIGRVEKGRGVYVESDQGSLGRAGPGFDHFGG